MRRTPDPYTVTVNRRKFLAAGLKSAALGTAARAQMRHQPARAPTALDPGKLTPFVDPLPIPEVLRSSETRITPATDGRRAAFYRVDMREIFPQSVS